MTDQREDGMRRDDDRRPRRHDQNGAWVGAVILIAVGAIFLARNMGVPMPRYWWAFFLLIPAAGALMAAARAYSNYGEMNGAVARPLIGAVIFVGLMLVFLLDVDIDWNLIWPVIPIVIGLGLLFRNYRRR